jgi:transcriptional regulator with XRE-family HTH domain
MIRIARAKRGWTIKDLAEKAEVSPSYLSELESNPDKRPSEDFIQKLATALGMPEDYINAHFIQPDLITDPFPLGVDFDISEVFDFIVERNSMPPPSDEDIDEDLKKGIVSARLAEQVTRALTPTVPPISEVYISAPRISDIILSVPANVIRSTTVDHGVTWHFLGGLDNDPALIPKLLYMRIPDAKAQSRISVVLTSSDIASSIPTVFLKGIVRLRPQSPGLRRSIVTTRASDDDETILGLFLKEITPHGARQVAFRMPNDAVAAQFRRVSYASSVRDLRIREKRHEQENYLDHTKWFVAFPPPHDT